MHSRKDRPTALGKYCKIGTKYGLRFSDHLKAEQQDLSVYLPVMHSPRLSIKLTENGLPLWFTMSITAC